MHKALPYKTKQFFGLVIKFTIVVGVFYFIYNKLTANPQLNFNTFIDFLKLHKVFSVKHIGIVLALTIVNWSLDILKWKILVGYLVPISYYESAKQSLGSLTASLLTPNRIGEYGVKAMYFVKKYRKKIMLLNLISNMLQMSVTVILGSIGFYICVTTYNIPIDYYRLSRFFIIIGTVVALTAFGVKQNKYTLRGFNPEKIKTFFTKLPLAIGGIAWLLSLLRYLVFSFQFFVLLYFFKSDLTYLKAMPLITAMYLLASIVPSIFIFDVVIKSGAAIFLFGFAGVNELTILCISTCMWLLNVVLPSCFGSAFVLQFKLPKV